MATKERGKISIDARLKQIFGSKSSESDAPEKFERQDLSKIQMRPYEEEAKIRKEIKEKLREEQARKEEEKQKVKDEAKKNKLKKVNNSTTENKVKKFYR